MVGGEVLGAAEDAGAGGVDLLWLMCAGKCILARVSEGGKREGVKTETIEDRSRGGCLLRRASMGLLVFGASHELLAPIVGDFCSLMGSASCGGIGSHCR